MGDLMKKNNFILVTLLLIVTSCNDNRHISHSDVPNLSHVEQVFYSGCYRPGYGYLGDNGRYYPDGWTYMCNGVAHRNGSPYRGSLLGNMAIGAYFLMGGPGYGNYGVTHTTVVNNNVTVIGKGSAEYTERLNRYKKTYEKREKSGWISKKEIARRKAQSKRDKARHQAALKSKSKKKGGFFSRTSSKKSKTTYKDKTRKKSSWGSSSRKSKSSWSRSSSRSRFKSSGRRYSDVRLKENIVALKNPIDTVSAIKGVYYNYSGENSRTVGVIAQDVEKVLPEIVVKNSDGFRTVDYELIVPVLIEAIKAQQVQIKELQKRLR
jgi:hypothetical protein